MTGNKIIWKAPNEAEPAGDGIGCLQPVFGLYSICECVKVADIHKMMSEVTELAEQTVKEEGNGVESEGVKLLRRMVHELRRTMGTVDEYLVKQNIMERVAASGKVDPSDPEQEFYIRNFTMLGEMMARMKIYTEYIEKPVKVEGNLKLTTSGAIMLNDEVIPSGSPFEFMVNGRWELGFIQQNSLTGQYTVFDPQMTEYKVDIDGLHARIR